MNIEPVLQISYSQNSFFINSVFNVLKVFRVLLSIWMEHQLSRAHTKVSNSHANSWHFYCRNLNLLRFALHLFCFQGSPSISISGLAPLWQLVGFFFGSNVSKELKFSQKEIGFVSGSYQAWWPQAFKQNSKFFHIFFVVFAWRMKSSMNVIACFLAIIWAKRIVMIWLKKIGRPHRPEKPRQTCIAFQQQRN